MKKLMAALIITSLILTACDEDSAQLGNLRVVHLTRGAEPVNLLIDDELIAEELNFTDSTNFISGPTEGFSLKLTSTSNENDTVYEDDFSPLQNPTTIYALPLSLGFRDSITLSVSNNFEAITNQAALRLIYASVELAFMVDIYVGQNTNNCTNLNGLSAYNGSYAEVFNEGQYLDPLSPGLYDICITEPSNPSNVLDGLIGIDLKAGSKQTLAVFDQTLTTLGFHILSDLDNDDPIVRESNLN